MEVRKNKTKWAIGVTVAVCWIAIILVVAYFHYLHEYGALQLQFAVMYHVFGLVGLLLILGFLFQGFFLERKHTNRAYLQAAHNKELFEMAISESKTYLWERVGEVMTFSDEFWRSHGMEPHTVTVEEMRACFTPESRALYEDNLRLSASGSSFVREMEADFFHTGEYHWYQVRSNVQRDSKGRVLRAYGIIILFDSFKKREKELIEARRLAEQAKMKESFLANISHEIRTPLNAIVGFSNLLATPGYEFTDEERAQFVVAINTNNNTLLRLINNVVEISGIESGEVAFSIEPFSLAALLENVNTDFKPHVPSHLTFTYLPAEGDVILKADKQRLLQVLMNLLDNACKFTRRGGITLGWKRMEEAKQVEIYVQDTGAGLSYAEQKMVFNRFYKKDEFVTGTGLGLSVSQLIMQRMGGSIQVSSEVGKGSVFSVFLPM